MCFDPATLTAISAVFSAKSAYDQGQAQAAAYNAQEKANEQNAAIAAKKAELAAVAGAKEERKVRQQGQQVMGAQRAAFAANGLDVSSGSPLDVLNDTSYQNEIDALTMRRNTANQVWGYQAEQTNYMNQASADKAAASNAKKAATMNMIGSLLTSAAGYSAYQGKVTDGGAVKVSSATSTPRILQGGPWFSNPGQAVASVSSNGFDRYSSLVKKKAATVRTYF